MEDSVLNPPLECDLVMKGGITSGVVYPLAIHTLATRYRFRSIGGTSAGAMAAGAAAAAEYGRESGGMDRLKELGNDLASEGFLRKLLRAESVSRPLMETLFELATTLPQGRRWRLPRLGLRFTSSVLIHTPTAFAAGALLGAGVSSLYALLTGGDLTGVGLITPLLFGWLGGLVGSAYKLGHLLLKDLPLHNFYGICNGHGEVAPGEPPLLTDWLHHNLQRLAGLDANAEPLTFRDLAKKPFADRQRQTARPAGHRNPNIELRVVTSNLSEGRPCVLPFDTNNFLFKVCEMEALFPQEVVAYMQRNAYIHPKIQPPQGYCWLPSGDRLPVIVAVRMSLSFPLLISAIPLYTIKASAFDRKGYPRVLTASDHNGPLVLTADDLLQNWFSDGGICSNFPIHFFDRWLPTRPTFGLNLVSHSKEQAASHNSDVVSMDLRSVSDIDDALDKVGSRTAALYFQSPRGPVEDSMCGSVFLPRADAPHVPEWRRVDGMAAFGMAIVNAAQNYRDAMQSALPSYHERIVQIRLSPSEGGMNLAMTPDAIDRIQKKGKHAASTILDRFSLEHHQWVRMAMLLSLIKDQLNAMERVMASQGFSYGELLAQQLEQQDQPFLDERFPYPQTLHWCKQSIERIETMRLCISQLKQRMKQPDAEHKEESLRRIAAFHTRTNKRQTENPNKQLPQTCPSSAERDPAERPDAKPVLRVTPEL